MRIALLLAPLALVGCTKRAAAAAATHGAPHVPPGGSDLSYLLLAAIGISILGIGLAVAAMVWMPVAKRMSLAACAGFSAILGVALVVKTIQPILPWIILGGGALLVGFGVYVVWKYHLMTRAAVAFGLDMSHARTDADEQSVKIKHAASQTAAGVKDGIDAVLAVVKEASKS